MKLVVLKFFFLTTLSLLNKVITVRSVFESYVLESLMYRKFIYTLFLNTCYYFIKKPTTT